MSIYRRADPIPMDRPKRHGLDLPSATGGTLKRDSLNRVAARTIFEAIAADTYPEGSVIPNEAVLGAQLGVSRTALREAIKGLVAKGVLKTRRRLGTVVCSRSEWNLLDPDIMDWTRLNEPAGKIAHDLQTILAALEPAIAARVARDKTQRRVIAEAHRALEAARTGGDRSSALVAFHRAIAAASGNVFALSIVTSIYGDLARNDPETLTRRLPGGAKAYAALAAAITAGDAEAASEAMRAVVGETVAA